VAERLAFIAAVDDPDLVAAAEPRVGRAWLAVEQQPAGDGAPAQQLAFDVKQVAGPRL
jgi:hypothetical protein